MRPGSIAIYGRTKIGKTVDANRCFERAITIETEPGAINSVIANLGREPPWFPSYSVDEPFQEAEGIIKDKLPAAAKKLGATAAILDTGTELAERIFAVKDEEWNHQGMLVYPQVGTQFKQIIRRLLATGLWVIALFHERKPKTIQGRYSRGGPKLPGSLVEETPALFDIVLHATIGMGKATGDMSGGGTRRVYQCDGVDSEWVSGDRFSATCREQPMDLRPIMYRIIHREEPSAALLARWGHKPEDFLR